MEGILEGLAIKFFVHELAVYGKGIDGAKLKADFAGKISGLLPKFWAEEAEKACNAVIDAAMAAMQDADGLQVVLSDLAAKDFAGAESDMIDLVGKLPGGHLFLQALGAA